MSSRTIIVTILAILVIIAGAALILVFLVKPGVSTGHPPKKTNSVSTIEPIAAQPGKLATYHSQSFPLSFQYPDGWIVEDTMGGITITSFKSDTGYSVGTVPEGGFQIDLSPSRKSTDTLNVWCRKPFEQDKFNKAMNLVISTTTDTLDRKGQIIAFDFKSQSDPSYNARVVCIEDNNTYIAIDASPLTASQLPLLNIIVDSVKADHDGRKF